MSAPTGNFRGQRTQSATGGYKTIGSSIASGNNSGSFKRIFVSALGNTNGNYDLAFTKTLGIPKNYYNSSSNSHYYQQPSLSGKTRQVSTDPNAKTLTQVHQGATVESTNCSQVPSPWQCNSYYAVTCSDYLPSGLFYLSSGISNTTYSNTCSQNVTPLSGSPQPQVLVIQSGDILRFGCTNTPYFELPVVVMSGGQINLKSTDGAVGTDGDYDIYISPDCNTCENNCITQEVINAYFPKGIYFNTSSNNCFPNLS